MSNHCVVIVIGSQFLDCINYNFKIFWVACQNILLINIPLVSKGSINKSFEFPSRVLEIISKLILFVKKATYMSVCN